MGGKTLFSTLRPSVSLASNQVDAARVFEVEVKEEEKKFSREPRRSDPHVPSAPHPTFIVFPRSLFVCHGKIRRKFHTPRNSLRRGWNYFGRVFFIVTDITMNSISEM